MPCCDVGSSCDSVLNFHVLSHYTLSAEAKQFLEDIRLLQEHAVEAPQNKADSEEEEKERDILFTNREIKSEIQSE